MAAMGIRKTRTCNVVEYCNYCKICHRCCWAAICAPKPTTFGVMSQLPSPSSEQLSLLDVQDDSPQQRSATSDTARHERLVALERRLNRSTTDPVDTSQPRSPDDTEDPQPFDVNHAKRIEFRRLVDPGIMRPNSKEVALRSMLVSVVIPVIRERTIAK